MGEISFSLNRHNRRQTVDLGQLEKHRTLLFLSTIFKLPPTAMLCVKPCAEMLTDNQELTLLQNCHNKETFTF